MARQKIVHGAEIDTVTPQELAEVIAKAFEEKRPEQYHRIRGIVNLDANGNGQNRPPDESINVPPQYDLLLERVVIGGVGAVNSVVCLYENQVQDTDLLEVIQMGAAGRYSDSFSNNLYIPANSQLFVVVTGGVANGQVTYNLQGRLVKR